MVPTLFGITLLTFVVSRLAPGMPLRPAGEMLSPGMTQVQLDALRAARGLDRPLWVQYGRWLGQIAKLDFGDSTEDGRPVSAKLAEAFPRTLLLASLALLVSFAIAVPWGVWSAARKGGWVDRTGAGVLFVLYSLPTFWVAILLLLALGDFFPMQGLFSPEFGTLPAWAKLRDVAWHLVLPVSCLSYAALASISRYTRSGMLEVLSQDYVRTARAKGLGERAVIWRHAFKNGALPVVTLFSLMLPAVLGGSVVVEEVFGIRGMGLLAFDAVLNRDYPMVMGITTVVALITMASMLLSDLAYALLDPRIGAA